MNTIKSILRLPLRFPAFTPCQWPSAHMPLFHQPMRSYNFKKRHTIFFERHDMKHPPAFHDDKWIRRRGGGWDEKLTTTNLKFLDDMIKSESCLKSPLKIAPWPKGKYTENSMRTGVLALKIGSFPQWTTAGKKFHCTLLQVLDNHVIDYMPPTSQPIPIWTTSPRSTLDSTKIGVCVVGALSCDPRKFTRSYNNLFTKAGCPPKRKLTRFFVSPNAAIQPGTPLYASHFRTGDYVDVQAKTIDYGFHGCMKRYGFKGQNKAHGVKQSHRKRGSVGSGRKRRRIMVGTKMPGHMGNRPRMLRGLRIWRIDNKFNVIYVNGPCIPGPNHAYVRIQDTVLQTRSSSINESSHPPFPTYYPGSDEKRDDEEFYDSIHRFSNPSITFK